MVRGREDAKDGVEFQPSSDGVFDYFAPGCLKWARDCDGPGTSDIECDGKNDKSPPGIYDARLRTLIGILF